MDRLGLDITRPYKDLTHLIQIKQNARVFLNI
jgi:hypothetical protein